GTSSGDSIGIAIGHSGCFQNFVNQTSLVQI
ncbi:unnamed protein product, partial [Cylindrotheca closterium]